MSSIKTITATMIRSILADDFNVGQLVADSERRKELAAIAPEEVDELVSRLQDVKAYVATAQEERRREALEALKSVIGDTGFTSVEELLAAAGGVTAPAPVKVKAASKGSSSNNKSFTVVIGQKSYTVINKQIPAGLRDSEAYQTLIKARPEMEKVDNLLREYSTDYQEAYPFNARFGNTNFHINTQGQPNAETKAQFELWKKHMKLKNLTPEQDKTYMVDFKKEAKQNFIEFK
ncbi:hypothetical protein [Enterobacter hormaechei]|uniref:hypothetical protein n=1 Tax=Enterobacter hormaechei TaxID=158836 RepID=UPI001E63F7BA|nr:hypothetical protein [Enterobacter hormaechei]MCC4525058.1 hypothetical protein [Enterobacter hormaechei]MCC4529143.1 hypothetical protein [Enterobacter hormaechei]MCC4534375.1 hypothetical protein [Enterobacter hormaechei]MCC4538751.1 hypothetical protein [Enterobacter hormaechei]